MKILTDIYPPEIKPVRDGLYLAVPEYFMSPDIRLDDFLLRRFQNGGWQTHDGALYEYPMYWRGLAFDPESAEPVDKFPDTFSSTPGYWIPEASDDNT